MSCSLVVLIAILVGSFAVGMREQGICELPRYALNELETTFTFEINRHGARAPFWDDPIAMADFSVSDGMLTAQGMRQRRLLGRSLKQLLKKPKDLYVESTDVYRTI